MTQRTVQIDILELGAFAVDDLLFKTVIHDLASPENALQFAGLGD